MATARARSREHEPDPPAPATVGALLRQLGVPPERVWLQPTPGTATERDVLRAHDQENRLCELIDGTLVEKTMGYRESEIALLIGYHLLSFVRPRDLGIVLGTDGTLRFLQRLVFIPDAAFLSWARLPGGKRPEEPIPDLVPDLAVEVLSKSNTKREMDRKLGVYFEAGVRLVWFVEPKTRTARVFTEPKASRKVEADGLLDGGDVLPGFALPLAELFPAG